MFLNYLNVNGQYMSHFTTLITNCLDIFVSNFVSSFQWWFRNFRLLIFCWLSFLLQLTKKALWWCFWRERIFFLGNIWFVLFVFIYIFKKLFIRHGLLSRGDTTSYTLHSASGLLYGLLHCKLSRSMISICIAFSCILWNVY
jgi:hypothetical protein